MAGSELGRREPAGRTGARWLALAEEVRSAGRVRVAGAGGAATEWKTEAEAELGAQKGAGPKETDLFRVGCS